MFSVIPVEGIPEVTPGDELADLILEAAELADYDVLVVTQKVVSKAEGRLVPLDPADPLARRRIVLSESAVGPARARWPHHLGNPPRLRMRQRRRRPVKRRRRPGRLAPGRP